MKILIEVSARHVHLSWEAARVLFDGRLCVERTLSQPGQYLCEEKIDVICSKKELLDVSVLGPQRAECQVEISKTDARMLKIDPPIRESGDLTGSPGCVLRNGNKIFETKNGVIIAKRHIHIDPQKAAANKIRHKNEYSLRIETVERPLVFGGVIARVDENFSAAVHIDTDEANAAGICGETYGKIMLY